MPWSWCLCTEIEILRQSHWSHPRSKDCKVFKTLKMVPILGGYLLINLATNKCLTNLYHTFRSLHVITKVGYQHDKPKMKELQLENLFKLACENVCGTFYYYYFSLIQEVPAYCV